MNSESLAQSLSDRYRIDRELGRGGMATVFLAEDLKHGRQVAIKVMHPEMAAAIGHARFLREIEIAARLTHPHILPLLDSGAADGQLYYVMPFIEGESLRDRLDRERQLSVEEAVRLARQVASALGYAHKHGLVHRDIKPENILLAEGIAIVADFGIARAVGSWDKGDATQIVTGGGLIGTPQYMAPEQASGGEVDGRTDLYALGCVFYEMLAGEPPFTGANPQALLQQHLNADPRPIGEHRSVPSGIEVALARTLAKLPVDRFPTAAAFAETLTMATSGLPTPTPTPSPKAGDAAVPNNLPKQRTHFIGREKELAECARLLGDTSLLTLTGIGGCGKTRLALKLASNLMDTYPDGVWFVDLAPVTDRERVVLKVATTLGVNEVPGVDLLATLADHVSVKRILLLLDNCEHVLAEAADLVEGLLAEGGEIKILATSREGLGVAGERPVAVRSLSVPKSDTGLELAAVEATESVRLFVDRAQVLVPEFQLNRTNAPVVAEIVRRLDGIPLALELAAARLKILSVDQIRDKLDDRFRLLTGGSRALPRHQTLRATIQWSHDHLDESEKDLFALLAVFMGGWTLDAATAVAGDDADEFEIMEILSRLVDKSLIQTERTESGSSRYSMLETVRQFAQEQLEESGAAAVARGRHLEFYLEFSKLAENIKGAEDPVWMARFNQELENFVLAHHWCDKIEDGARKGILLLGRAHLFWGNGAGSLDFSLRTQKEALARPGAEDGSLEHMFVLRTAAILAYRLGRYEESHSFAEPAVEIARKIADKADYARALGWLAHATAALSRAPETVEPMYREAMDLARESGNNLILTTALIAMGEHHRFHEHFDEAWENYEEALELSRKSGNPRTTSIILENEARVLIPKGDLAPVSGLVLECVGHIIDNDMKPMATGLFDIVAGLLAERKDWEGAARFLGIADALYKYYDYHREPVDLKFADSVFEKTKAAMDSSAYQAAYEAGLKVGVDDGLAETRKILEK